MCDNSEKMSESSENEPEAIRQARALLINGDIFHKISSHRDHDR